jgi:hypothetical protein
MRCGRKPKPSDARAELMAPQKRIAELERKIDR